MGVPMMNALYTVVNEFEQIRSQVLVPSKSFDMVATAYSGIQKGLEQNGLPQTQLQFTDNAVRMFASRCPSSR